MLSALANLGSALKNAPRPKVGPLWKANMFTRLRQYILLLLLSILTTQATIVDAKPPASKPDSDKAINIYIHQNWATLQRDMAVCAAYTDPKIGASHTLYLPHGYPITPELAAIRKKCNINILHLTHKIDQIGDLATTDIKPHGLLYLPKPYVVPGGRFNEMYGWDSYFIILGLLDSGQFALANNIVENYFFEIEYYGAILNANRTYHLNRSQPPFLTSAILSIYQSALNPTPNNKHYLSRAYQYAVKEYQQWNKAPFAIDQLHLSRYYDNESTRLVEATAYPNYYEHVYKYIKQHPDTTAGYLNKLTGKLDPEFYRGERSLRASGFDITSRFGPFGGRTQEYAPVCLNSLLYKTEQDLALMAKILDKPREAQGWLAAARQRKAAITQYLFNAETGLFVDYNSKTQQQSDYAYVTTFYPLWSGVATPEQAAAVVKNLKLFEYQGGLAMSDQTTGTQWDKPFGWAPMQMLAVKGLLRYGYHEEALRIATKFNTLVKTNFIMKKGIFEKYNVVNGGTDTKFIGYKGNAIGFGWTNATYTFFQKLQKIENSPTPDAETGSLKS